MIPKRCIAVSATLLCMVAACTPEQPSQPEENPPAAAPPDPEGTSASDSRPAETKKPLDLSLAEDFFNDPENTLATEPKPRNFDAGALFDKTDDSATKVRVLPHLKPGEQPTDMPQVDGGTVSVEKKTK